MLHINLRKTLDLTTGLSKQLLIEIQLGGLFTASENRISRSMHVFTRTCSCV